MVQRQNVGFTLVFLRDKRKSVGFAYFCLGSNEKNGCTLVLLRDETTVVLQCFCLGSNEKALVLHGFVGPTRNRWFYIGFA